MLYKNNHFDGATFFCQQAVEKALKALLIKKTGKFPKIHDLTKLARSNNAPKTIVVLCAKINLAYTTSRYPDSPKKYTKKECKLVLKYCQKVLEWIKKNL